MSEGLLSTAEVAEATGWSHWMIAKFARTGAITPAVRGANNAPFLFAPDVLDKLPHKDAPRPDGLVTLRELAALTGYTYNALRQKVQAGRLIPVISGAAAGSYHPHLFTPDCLPPKPGYTPPKQTKPERTESPKPQQTDRPCRKCAYCTGSFGRCLRWHEYVGADQTCAAWMPDGWRTRKGVSA